MTYGLEKNSYTTKEAISVIFAKTGHKVGRTWIGSRWREALERPLPEGAKPRISIPKLQMNWLIAFAAAHHNTQHQKKDFGEFLDRNKVRRIRMPKIKKEENGQLPLDATVDTEHDHASMEVLLTYVQRIYQKVCENGDELDAIRAAFE